MGILVWSDIACFISYSDIPSIMDRQIIYELNSTPISEVVSCHLFIQLCVRFGYTQLILICFSSTTTNNPHSITTNSAFARHTIELHHSMCSDNWWCSQSRPQHSDVSKNDSHNICSHCCTLDEILSLWNYVTDSICGRLVIIEIFLPPASLLLSSLVIDVRLCVAECRHIMPSMWSCLCKILRGTGEWFSWSP